MDDDNRSDGEENNESNDGDSADVDTEEDYGEEEQQFDKSLAATHSYMGLDLVTISGRSVLEAGWRGRVPVGAHHGTVFPGEAVPMLITNPHDVLLLSQTIKQDKLFGLLCPDESGTMVSGYGVLCEVFEAGLPTEDAAASLSFIARANHRFRFVDMPKHAVPIYVYTRMRYMEIQVLPEVKPHDPLSVARLASLDVLRRAGAGTKSALQRRLRGMDAALTTWPLFVYDIFDYGRMRNIIKDHFRTLMFEAVPEEPVSLSFWTASNLALSARDRLALFVVDDALLRLHMEVRLIAKKSVLCCSSCTAEVAQRDHMFAMSSEGVHSNYTNPGGYMHDIVTVSRATNVSLSGRPSSEFSWFPGYTWTIAVCASCMAHVGWRFDAERRSLRPQQFYGLCRNYVHPRPEDDAERL